jgi:hypothetical protein
MTDVTAIVGTIGELIGEGIDLDWTVTIGGLEQDSNAILLPSKVSYEVNALTPLGDQEFKIENVDGDYSVYTDPFLVTDSMRIITVYQPDPVMTGDGKVYGLPNGFGSGGQSTSLTAEFRIYGIGFDPASTVTVQKSSQADQPQNYLSGGDNTTIHTAGVIHTSSTELRCVVSVSDIPAGHDASIGGDAFGVMYYDVIVTNPNGDTFIEKASSYSGAHIDMGEAVGNNGEWDATKYSSGNGIRVWGYTLPWEMKIEYISGPSGSAPNQTWSIEGDGFENDGTGPPANLTTVVTLMDTLGESTIWHPTLDYNSNSPQTIGIISSALDTITGLYPPAGVYDVTVTNLNGSSDTLVAGVTIA